MWKEKAIFIFKDKGELKDHFNFFISLLGKDQILGARESGDQAMIETERYKLEFILPDMSMRGKKANYVFNTVQDLEFHNMCALPMLASRNYMHYKKSICDDCNGSGYKIIAGVGKITYCAKCDGVGRVDAE